MARRQRVCRECKQAIEGGLKKHWEVFHPEQYRKVAEWLGATTVRLKAAEMLAKDGMKGPGEPEEEP